MEDRKRQAAVMDNRPTLAISYCREAVRQRLESPRTAKFKSKWNSPTSDATREGVGRFVG